MIDKFSAAGNDNSEFNDWTLNDFIDMQKPNKIRSLEDRVAEVKAEFEQEQRSERNRPEVFRMVKEAALVLQWKNKDIRAAFFALVAMHARKDDFSNINEGLGKMLAGMQQYIRHGIQFQKDLDEEAPRNLERFANQLGFGRD